jgi:hypothetical protein
LSGSYHPRHLLKGGHIALEEFFRWQLGRFGRVGSMVEGWNMAHPMGVEPKPWPHAGIPTMVRRYFTEHGASVLDARGVKWPTPMPLMLGPGDAAISTYLMPHAPSKNERGEHRPRDLGPQRLFLGPTEDCSSPYELTILY